MTQAFNDGLSFRLQVNGAFEKIEEADDVGGFGSDLELIEATSFDSNGFKEFIAGLEEGKEFTVACNYILTAPVQRHVKANKGLTNAMQLEFTDGTDTETYQCNVVYKGWSIAPGLSDKHKIEFMFKITGEIEEV